MTFNPNLPLASDKLRVFPGDITTNNWPRLQTIISADHQFNNSAAANDGWHKVIHMIEQGSDPTTAANTGGLYGKAVAGANQLFYRKPSNSTIIQITGDTTAAASGSTFLPGGIILKWGIQPSVSDNTSISFSSAFTTNCWNVSVTPIRNNTATRVLYVRTGSVTTSGFIVRTDSSGGLGLYYQAIGN